MDGDESGKSGTPATFVAAVPKAGRARAATETSRRDSYGTYLAALPRVFGPRTTDLQLHNRAFAVLIITAIGLVVVPDLITYLQVEHSPILPPGESAAFSEVPLAQLASLAGSALLLLLSTAVALMRGPENRDITGLLVLLLAVNLPYLVNPHLPPPADLPKIVLANMFILALWNIGAPIAELKWFPITVAAISVYSLIGGLLIPEYMMYNVDSQKDIIPGWELAGPFGHANVLGMYCALAFALVPLIVGTRWRWVIATILFVTLLAAASRTALIATAMVLLWWAFCWLRGATSVRLVGTLLAGFTATAMFVFPFLDWDPSAFTDRAYVWAESLRVWQQSPWVGMGVNWFLVDAQSLSNIAKWAFVGTGHNLVVDTLVRSGLLGVAVLVPLLVAAILSVRALRATNQQMACFGFLMAFFVAATTEAVWALLPNLQLFPISGLIFAVLILGRRGTRVDGPPPLEGSIREH
ncbi:MAG: O-antigen ligase family protein [Mycobacterium sp.]